MYVILAKFSVRRDGVERVLHSSCLPRDLEGINLANLRFECES